MNEENSRERPGLYAPEDEGVIFFATSGTDPLIVRRHIPKNGVLKHIAAFISRLKKCIYFCLFLRNNF